MDYKRGDYCVRLLWRRQAICVWGVRGATTNEEKPVLSAVEGNELKRGGPVEWNDPFGRASRVFLRLTGSTP